MDNAEGVGDIGSVRRLSFLETRDRRAWRIRGLDACGESRDNHEHGAGLGKEAWVYQPALARCRRRPWQIAQVRILTPAGGEELTVGFRNAELARLARGWPAACFYAVQGKMMSIKFISRLVIAGLVTASVVAPSAPAAAADETAVPLAYPRNELRSYLSWALSRGTGFPNDGHFDDVPTFDAGLEVDFLHAFGPVGRIGVGLRYAYGTGNNVYGGARESEHWVFAPMLLGWSIGSQHGRVDLLLGLGLAGAAVTFGARPGKPYLYAFGYGAELAPSYTIALGRRLGLSVGLAGRLLVVGIQNGEPADYYMQNTGGFHGEITARCGLAFDL